MSKNIERHAIESTEVALQKRRAWAMETAKKFGVEIDEGAQHFVIHLYDTEGNLTRTDKLPTWEKIPLEKRGGDEKTPTIDIEDALRAVKKYPELGLREGVEKIHEDAHGEA